jgi:type III secretory pathway component EscV
MATNQRKQHFSNSEHSSKTAISENLTDLMLALWTLALIVMLPMLVPTAFVGAWLAFLLLITHFLFLRT